MAIMKLGNPATGEDFFGRTQELGDLWRYLESDHIRFPGVRRLGKTSILRRLEGEAADRGLLAKWLDVSNINSAKEFVALLDREFPENAIKRFLSDKAQQVGGWFKRIRKIDATLPDAVGGVGFGIEFGTDAVPEWQKAANTLHSRLHDQPLLILLDEFPVMLKKLIQRDRQEAEQILSWLRIWRQSSGSCRFVFTGSIGLLTHLSRQPEGLTLDELSSRLSKREPNPDRCAQRLQELLVRLTDEGYTSTPDGNRRVQFLSFPLRDWWNRNHV